MAPVFLALALVFAAESQSPELPQVRYPAWEQKDDIRRRVDAHLTLQMEIAADGVISRVTFIAQENIPAERLENYVESFKSQLEGRKAKPAMRDGRAIACTYKHIFVWPLFVPPPERHRYPEDEPRRRSEMDGEGAPTEAVKLREVEHRSYVDTPDGREIPMETFKAELDSKARSLMNSAAIRERKDGPMLLCTDEPSAEQMAFTTDILRALPVTFSTLFKNVLPPHPALPEFTVYLFHSPGALAQFQKALGVPHWADGSYMGALKILAASISSGHPYRTREILIHEETHFLVRELLIPKTACPVWLNEGLAEVFSGSRIDRAGHMTFSAIDAGEYLDKRTGRVWMSRSEIHRRLLVEEHSALKGNVLKRLLTGDLDPGENTPEEAIRRFYACAWAFTRFLIGDGNIAVRREFLDLIAALNAGRDARTVLLASYSTYEDMEKMFWKAVRKW